MRGLDVPEESISLIMTEQGVFCDVADKKMSEKAAFVGKIE